MIKRSYIDANLLIAAWKGDDEAGSAALAVLDDWERTLLVSDALWLEVMPKATYEKKHGENGLLSKHLRACGVPPLAA